MFLIFNVFFANNSDEVPLLIRCHPVARAIRTLRGLKGTKYASVNKRIRSLEKSGYIIRTGFKETKAGFKSSLYELTSRAYLAMSLSSISLEELLFQLDETGADAFLADILSATRY